MDVSCRRYRSITLLQISVCLSSSIKPSGITTLLSFLTFVLATWVKAGRPIFHHQTFRETKHPAHPGISSKYVLLKKLRAAPESLECEIHVANKENLLPGETDYEPKHWRTHTHKANTWHEANTAASMPDVACANNLFFAKIVFSIEETDY